MSAIIVNIRKAPEEEAGPMDCLIACIAYIPTIIIALVILLTNMKNRPFRKYHALQALIAQAPIFVILVAIDILSATQLIPTNVARPLIGIAMGLFLIPASLWAVHALEGNYFEIPMITAFARQQGWLS